MHFWIVQTGEPVFTDGPNVRPMRAMNLASMAIEKGHQVTLITSNFDHFSKRKRFAADKYFEVSENLAIQFVDSPGYKRNISPQRFYDHFVMGKRMAEIASKLQAPDAVLLGYPPIETSWFMARLCKDRGISYILDVKDAWPSNIVAIFPQVAQKMVKLILTPYFKMFSFAAVNAAKVCSISSEFLNWSQFASKRGKQGRDFVAYLSSKEMINSEDDLVAARNWFNSNVILKKEIPTVYFVGSLSRSFDFDQVLTAAGTGKFNLIIAGDGEQMPKLKERTKSQDNVHLVGWVDSAQSEVIASNSDFALAPMKPLLDFEMSIPNKYFDYLRRGTPIISSLNGPSRNLLESEHIGFFFQSAEEILEIVERQFADPVALNETSKRCIEVFYHKFSYEKVYGSLLNEMENLVK